MFLLALSALHLALFTNRVEETVRDTLVIPN
jgi:hypothetical protein